MKTAKGIFVRNGNYFIRFADQFGKTQREKVGPLFSTAKEVLLKRRAEVSEGKFFPERQRRRLHLFEEIAKDFLAWSKQNRRDHRHNEFRAAVLLELWGNLPLAELTPGRIQHDAGATRHDQNPSPRSGMPFPPCRSHSLNCILPQLSDEDQVGGIEWTGLLFAERSR